MDETPPDGLSAAEVARALALRKAAAVTPPAPDALLLTADTVVALPSPGGALLGKPRDPADACRMLRGLSGRSHEVATGVALRGSRGTRSAVDVAIVRFRELTEAEIQAYVAGGEPMDKAGAYAIQGGAAAFVAHLEGDLETVIGLPTALVRRLLEAEGPTGR